MIWHSKLRFQNFYLNEIRNLFYPCLINHQNLVKNLKKLEVFDSSKKNYKNFIQMEFFKYFFKNFYPVNILNLSLLRHPILVLTNFKTMIHFANLKIHLMHKFLHSFQKLLQSFALKELFALLFLNLDLIMILVLANLTPKILIAFLKIHYKNNTFHFQVKHYLSFFLMKFS